MVPPPTNGTALDTDSGSDDPPDMPESGWKLLKQIIGKLNDWAPLSAIALYLLAVPVGTFVKNYFLSFGGAFAFSIVLIFLRAYQMALQARNLSRKIDAERDLKLEKARNDFQIKIARLNRTNAPAIASNRQSSQNVRVGSEGGKKRGGP